jgi:hypothetical protein
MYAIPGYITLLQTFLPIVPSVLPSRTLLALPLSLTVHLPPVLPGLGKVEFESIPRNN